MEKTDALVSIDPEANRIIIRFGPDWTGSTVSMSPDQAQWLAKLILEAVTHLSAVNAKPKA
jgi:hypothetical protein